MGGRNRYLPGRVDNKKSSARDRMLETLKRTSWLTTQMLGARMGITVSGCRETLRRLEADGLVVCRRCESNLQEWSAVK